MDEWLASEESGRAFSHCIRCKWPLLELDTLWLVNKEIIRAECVLEYAICQSCRDAVTASMSEESKGSVREFLETEIDWDARTAEFVSAHDPVARFDACIACRRPREELQGYGISALFDSGGHLVSGPLPLLVCRSCINRMTARLSEQSRAAWRDFLTENFECPPDDPGFPGMF